MKKLTATLCLTIAVLLGSTFVMVVPIPAEAGALTAVFKAIFGESDKVVKGIDKSADDLATGASKTTDDATSKIEGGDKGYDENIIANRVQREINKKKNKCQSNRWAIVEFPDSNLYSKPKINSTIIGALDKPDDSQTERVIELYMLYPVTAGSKNVYVVVDPGNTIVEANEGDNIVRISTELGSSNPFLDVAGEVAGKVKKWVRGDTEYVDTDEIKKELGDVLWYVSQMAETFGLGLEDIAQANVDKLRSRMERDKIKGDGDNR